MGHKVNPIGFRLGISAEWSSVWYADRNSYTDSLRKDLKIREFLRKALAHASVSRIGISRTSDVLTVAVHSARPGTVIGKKGEDVEALRRKVAEINEADVSKVSVSKVRINIEEIRKPEMDAHLIAENIAQQLERRIMFRRAMKRAVQNALRLGVSGVKVAVAGRLNGAEIARREWYREGRMPLHTLKANIDYGVARAYTTYGVIGVKAWIYKAEGDDSPVNPGLRDNKPRRPGSREARPRNTPPADRKAGDSE